MMISLAADKKVRWDWARRLARSPFLRLSWELWPEVTKAPKAVVEEGWDSGGTAQVESMGFGFATDWGRTD